MKLESYEEKKSKIENEPKKQTEVHHPLVKAGLISDNLAEILLVPDFEVKSSCAPNRGKKRARILTSEEVEKELEEKENIKKEKEEKNKQRKIKQTEKKAAMIVKKEEIRQRKEIREKKKLQKLKIMNEKYQRRPKVAVKREFPQIQDIEENTGYDLTETQELMKTPTLIDKQREDLLNMKRNDKIKGKKDSGNK